MPQWTPGPWEIKREHCDTSFAGSEQIVSIGPLCGALAYYSCSAHDGDRYLCVSEADARLIATAPKLLEACQALAHPDGIIRDLILGGPELDNLNEVISEAEGNDHE